MVATLFRFLLIMLIFLCAAGPTASVVSKTPANMDRRLFPKQHQRRCVDQTRAEWTHLPVCVFLLMVQFPCWMAVCRFPSPCCRGPLWVSRGEKVSPDGVRLYIQGGLAGEAAVGQGPPDTGERGSEWTRRERFSCITLQWVWP